MPRVFGEGTHHDADGDRRGDGTSECSGHERYGGLRCEPECTTCVGYADLQECCDKREPHLGRNDCENAGPLAEFASENLLFLDNFADGKRECKPVGAKNEREGGYSEWGLLRENLRKQEPDDDRLQEHCGELTFVPGPLLGRKPERVEE